MAGEPAERCGVFLSAARYHTTEADMAFEPTLTQINRTVHGAELAG